MYKFFTSLVKFTPKYFILSDAILNGIIFLISFLVSSLLVYRNATDFHVLILYPATLLNSFISSNRFFVESLGFSTYKIMSSANIDNFTYFFPVLMLLFLFLV